MKPDYGLDAPKVVRNLFLIALGLSLAALLSFNIQNTLWFWVLFLGSVFCSLVFFAAGCLLLYGIKVTKPIIVSNMIDNLHLKGSETVLDLGCGRGLVLCKIAQKLPKGKAIGIDLWSTRDQSGNCPEKTLENAQAEGVKNRVSVQTGDVCALPFADNAFDVVISSLCLHNIKDKQKRKLALLELFRVLKPGGKFAIADIQHSKEYAHVLSSQGASARISSLYYAYCPPIRTVEGQK